jgi:hypothetical protein
VNSVEHREIKETREKGFNHREIRKIREEGFEIKQENQNKRGAVIRNEQENPP